MQIDCANNNKRMLKNTFVLYVRMALTMSIGFFTTREVLIALGIVDFGLANVIGSVALMFSFLSGIMQATVSKYLSTDIGLKDGARLRQTFNLTMLIYLSLILLVIVLSETVGLWFFDNKLLIATERRSAGLLFFQFSIAALVFGILSVPYVSLVISHEEIKVYAWIGTAESLARLLIVYALYLGDYDRLATYGALLALVALMNLIAYGVYCLKKYPECRPMFFWDSSRCKEMLTFAMWNLWGALSGLFSNVFLNILLNSYFGSVVNAARGIAMQGATGVSSFVNNFLTAARPQIFKYYAEGNKGLAAELASKSARLGYFLLYIISLPVILEMDYVLTVWLTKVPDGAGSFMQLVLIQRLVEILAYPLVTLSHASGRIALYQTVVGALQWAVFPISWIALEEGGGANSVFWISISLAAVALLAQLCLINYIVAEFCIKRFFKNAVWRSVMVSITSMPLPMLIHLSMQQGFPRFLTVCGLSFVCVSVTVYFLGLEQDEKHGVDSYLANKLRINTD